MRRFQLELFHRALTDATVDVNVIGDCNAADVGLTVRLLVAADDPVMKGVMLNFETVCLAAIIAG